MRKTRKIVAVFASICFILSNCPHLEQAYALTAQELLESRSNSLPAYTPTVFRSSSQSTTVPTSERFEQILQENTQSTFTAATTAQFETVSGQSQQFIQERQSLLQTYAEQNSQETDLLESLRSGGNDTLANRFSQVPVAGESLFDELTGFQRSSLLERFGFPGTGAVTDAAALADPTPEQQRYMDSQADRQQAENEIISEHGEEEGREIIAIIDQYQQEMGAAQESYENADPGSAQWFGAKAEILRINKELDKDLEPYGIDMQTDYSRVQVNDPVGSDPQIDDRAILGYLIAADMSEKAQRDCEDAGVLVPTQENVQSYSAAHQGRDAEAALEEAGVDLDILTPQQRKEAVEWAESVIEFEETRTEVIEYSVSGAAEGLNYSTSGVMEESYGTMMQEQADAEDALGLSPWQMKQLQLRIANEEDASVIAANSNYAQEGQDYAYLDDYYAGDDRLEWRSLDNYLASNYVADATAEQKLAADANNPYYRDNYLIPGLEEKAVSGDQQAQQQLSFVYAVTGGKNPDGSQIEAFKPLLYPQADNGVASAIEKTISFQESIGQPLSDKEIRLLFQHTYEGQTGQLVPVGVLDLLPEGSVPADGRSDAEGTGTATPEGRYSTDQLNAEVRSIQIRQAEMALPGTGNAAAQEIAAKIGQSAQNINTMLETGIYDPKLRTTTISTDNEIKVLGYDDAGEEYTRSITEGHTVVSEDGSSQFVPLKQTSYLTAQDGSAVERSILFNEDGTLLSAQDTYSDSGAVIDYHVSDGEITGGVETHPDGTLIEFDAEGNILRVVDPSHPPVQGVISAYEDHEVTYEDVVDVCLDTWGPVLGRIAVPLALLGGAEFKVFGIDPASIEAKEAVQELHAYTGGLGNVPAVAIFGLDMADPYNTEILTLGERAGVFQERPIELLEFGTAVVAAGGGSLIAAGARAIGAEAAAAMVEPMVSGAVRSGAVWAGVSATSENAYSYLSGDGWLGPQGTATALRQGFSEGFAFSAGIQAAGLSGVAGKAGTYLLGGESRAGQVVGRYLLGAQERLGAYALAPESLAMDSLRGAGTFTFVGPVFHTVGWGLGNAWDGIVNGDWQIEEMTGPRGETGLPWYQDLALSAASSPRETGLWLGPLTEVAGLTTAAWDPAGTGRVAGWARNTGQSGYIRGTIRTLLGEELQAAGEGAVERSWLTVFPSTPGQLLRTVDDAVFFSGFTSGTNAALYNDFTRSLGMTQETAELIGWLPFFAIPRYGGSASKPLEASTVRNFRDLDVYNQRANLDILDVSLDRVNENAPLAAQGELLESLDRDALQTATAGELHSRWRDNYARENGQESMRLKDPKDDAWVKQVIQEFDLKPGQAGRSEHLQVVMDDAGKVQVDIAHTDFEYLPQAWKNENAAAAVDGVEAVYRTLQTGSTGEEMQNALKEAEEWLDSGRVLDDQFVGDSAARLKIMEAGEYIHTQWLERNGSWAPENQKLPFRDLDVYNQRADLNILDATLNILEKIGRSRIASTIFGRGLRFEQSTENSRLKDLSPSEISDLSSRLGEAEYGTHEQVLSDYMQQRGTPVTDSEARSIIGLCMGGPTEAQVRDAQSQREAGIISDPQKIQAEITRLQKLNDRLNNSNGAGIRSVDFQIEIARNNEKIQSLKEHLNGLVQETSAGNAEKGIFATPISEELIGKLMPGDMVDAQGAITSRPDRWTVTSTSLDDINLKFKPTLGAKIEDMIVEKTRQAQQEGRELVVLDWGCGEGAMMSGLLDRLPEDVKKSIRLYGLSNTYFDGWENIAERGGKIIFDDAENIGRYFKDGELDVVLSNMGLLHMKDPAYYDKLSELLKPGGILLSDLDQTVSNHVENVFGELRVRPEYESYRDKFKFLPALVTKTGQAGVRTNAESSLRGDKPTD